MDPNRAERQSCGRNRSRLGLPLTLALFALTRILVLAVLLTPRVFFTAHTAEAQTPQPTVQVAPATVQLPETGETNLLIVVRNPTGQAVRTLHLSSFPADGVRIDFTPADTDALQPDANWVVNGRLVRADLTQRIPTVVYVRLDYHSAADSVDTPGNVVVSSIQVARGAPLPASQALDIQVQSALKNLREGHAGVVYLLVTNKLDSPVTVTQVDPTAPPGATVTARDSGSFTLDVAQTRLLTFDVTRGVASEADLGRTGQQLLLFRAVVDTNGVSRDAIATLPVEIAAPDPLDQVAQVQVETSTDSLLQTRPGRMLVIVTNKGDGPLTVVNVVAHGPTQPFSSAAPGASPMPMVMFSPAQPAPPVVLGPEDTQSFDVEVTPTSLIQPGKHVVDFDVTVQHDGRTAHLASSTEISIAVLGQSELLAVLATPSLLVVPGFLLVALFAWFGRVGWLKPRGAPTWPGYDTLDPKNPIFWVCAVTLSMMFGAVYTVITQRPYLQTYGVGDVVWLWAISISIGIALYLVTALVLRALWARSAPSANDGPLELLQKLARRKRSLTAMHASASGTESVWLVDPFSTEDLDDSAVVWVAPQIVYTRVPAELRNDVEEVLQHPDTPRATSRLLRLFQKAARATPAAGADRFVVRYDDDRRPRQVQVRHLTQTESRQLVHSGD